MTDFEILSLIREKNGTLTYAGYLNHSRSLPSSNPYEDKMRLTVLEREGFVSGRRLPGGQMTLTPAGLHYLDGLGNEREDKEFLRQQVEYQQKQAKYLQEQIEYFQAQFDASNRELGKLQNQISQYRADETDRYRAEAIQSDIDFKKQRSHDFRIAFFTFALTCAVDPLQSIFDFVCQLFASLF